MDYELLPRPKMRDVVSVEVRPKAAPKVPRKVHPAAKPERDLLKEVTDRAAELAFYLDKVERTRARLDTAVSAMLRGGAKATEVAEVLGVTRQAVERRYGEDLAALRAARAAANAARASSGEASPQAGAAGAAS